MEYINEIKEAPLDVCKGSETFLQSAMWGEFKSRFGWSAKAFLICLQKESFPLLVLCRRLAPGFSFAYIPWGPEFPMSFNHAEKPKAAAEIAKKIKPFLTHNTVFARFEPAWENDKLEIGDWAGFKKGTVVQAPDTVIVDLATSCEEILARMKPKWRYNISLAAKKGVQVNVTGDLETFYNLLKETALRDGISVHNFNYYKTLFEICEKQEKETLRLYTASHENDTLAAIVVLFRGKDAVYLYGASSNEKRNLMAPYALQWRAMLDAKEALCLNYDLFGIPPNEDPNHPMAGLYRFKTGFGGKIIRRAGSRDYPYNPFLYTLFSIAEKLRKNILKRSNR
ncbi:MAG: peptidoglycan bridge formation glycyltransferase FemA/FemB family protein [Treponema sp.]|nr:peptidoglycan bridge formation glycyltransferase FemA/FemB family protein [Treponema sp.]